jgi:hypothetical protein
MGHADKETCKGRRREIDFSIKDAMWKESANRPEDYFHFTQS